MCLPFKKPESENAHAYQEVDDTGEEKSNEQEPGHRGDKLKSGRGKREVDKKRPAQVSN